ncbi:hypothetical protein PG993_014793 [Apiospora rasikravindrae]|uniref:Uncharacterized protein n=1 Tax=Apiospora rasikravindrae TaxID=990691 RepID=A0ABR1RNR1_9PEZI
MRFFTVVPFLSTLVGLSMASPVPDAAPGTSPGPTSTIFKYCTETDFGGTCNRDDSDSLNHCETSSFKTIESLKVYKGYKCTIYMKQTGCTGDSRTYTEGEVPNIPSMFRDFKSYKCVTA